MEIKPVFKTNAVLSNGDYCEVTREQAIELFEIEGEFIGTDSYIVQHFASNYPNNNVRWDSEELILSGHILTIDRGQQLTFPDFKERLVNTVKTSNLKTNI